MSTTKSLYLAGLESHGNNVRAQHDLIAVGRVVLAEEVSGVENLEIVKQAGKELGGGLLAVSKWVGGNTLKALTTVLGGAGNALSKAFADNEVLIRKIMSSLDRRESFEYNVSGAALSIITSEGDSDQIKSDLKQLLETLTLFSKHQKEVNDHLSKQLMVVKKLKGTVTTDLILKVVEEFEALSYPTFKLGNKKDNTYSSDILPGGRFFEFTQTESGSVKYTMRNEDVSSSGSSTLSMDKSEVNELLSLLGKVNGVYKDIKGSYDNYLSFIRSWADTVKGVSKSLDTSKAVSASVLGEAEKLLSGDSNVLAFYSGFTPRVVSYTDRYISTAIGVFA